ncbi:hypothetical protein K504DRAFT_497195 [Pleomassaria siparia CBS 279.74]|uniref:Uncharacterized protein n=1 Tax=Pleomassaria siparia CBS 279.74 TaxID=1314801 RepID=A0A6G1KRS9_9PLEO|nr:hypothetical protein K504DRAFT_497195 [Pleomassaria siparia CBS 279.74]
MVGLENTYFILQIAAGLAAMIAVPWGAFAFYWGYKAHSCNSTEAKSSAAPKLSKQITSTWGSEEKFREAFNAALLGLLGVAARCGGRGRGKDQRLSRGRNPRHPEPEAEGDPQALKIIAGSR